MTSELQGPYGVAVGVEGSEHGYVAVAYAAVEAERLGLPLDVVHVLPAGVPVEVAKHPVPDESLQRYGADILSRARQVALEAVPTLEIRAHLDSGARTHELVGVGREAALLVLGCRSPRVFDRIWTGGTVIGVASSVACPLIVVPADWEQSTRHHRIVIGVKSPGKARDLFDIGFPLAADRGAELVVVHAWRLDGIYDDIVADRTRNERWEHDRAEEIEQEVAAYRTRFPGVPVHVFVRHESPAHALVRVSRGADRLLVQRQQSGPLAPHLGGVARAVLRDAHCPITVLPEHVGAPTFVSDQHAGELVP